MFLDSCYGLLLSVHFDNSGGKCFSKVVGCKSSKGDGNTLS